MAHALIALTRSERLDLDVAELDPEPLGLESEVTLFRATSFHSHVTAPLTQRLMSLPLQVIS